MPNSIFGTAPHQAPRNSDLGRLAYLNLLGRHVVVLTASQSWSPPHECNATIIVTGSGGGNITRQSAYDGSTAAAAGGTAIKYGQRLLPTVAYTAVVSSGGAGSANQTSNPGSASSFSGSNMATLTANGGAGAMYLQSGVAPGFSCALGGTATGGDINMQGGHGFGNAVPNCTVGSAISSSLLLVASMPGGTSYWGIGAAPGTAAANYGSGALGIGASSSTVMAGAQGVIVIVHD